MLDFPNIDPVLLSLGPLKVRWYGLMYVLGFTASYLLVQHQIKRYRLKELKNHFENLNLVLILSVIIGGRLGYVIFYNPEYYLAHPLEILATWSGGMSFHGACFTLILTGFIYTYKYKLNFLQTADIYVATIPIGLGLGRLGNFINGELYGRTTDLPWGMIFPSGGALPRHPSQLYEATLEGLVLFTILWFIKDKPWKSSSTWPHGTVLAFFVFFYGIFRIIIELFREPDPQLGFLFHHFTMGQLLSTIMIVAGFSLFIYLFKQKVKRRES